MKWTKYFFTRKKDIIDEDTFLDKICFFFTDKLWNNLKSVVFFDKSSLSYTKQDKSKKQFPISRRKNIQPLKEDVRDMTIKDYERQFSNAQVAENQQVPDIVLKTEIDMDETINSPRIRLTNRSKENAE